MDFEFSEREEAFRKDVRAWLEANLPDDLRGMAFASSRADRGEVRREASWRTPPLEFRSSELLESSSGAGHVPPLSSSDHDYSSGISSPSTKSTKSCEWYARRVGHHVLK